MALRNRYVARESDIWPSETDMWLESQIYGTQKQLCGWRVEYMALETYFRPDGPETDM